MHTSTTQAARSWARANYRGKAHLVEPGRRFACGTHTGYGLLIFTDETWGRCSRCVGILKSREALEAAQARVIPAVIPAAEHATETTTVSGLRVDDVVWSSGMKLLVVEPPHRTMHPLDDGGETWATPALILEAHGLVTCTSWTLQGNDRRAVAREVRA